MRLNQQLLSKVFVPVIQGDVVKLQLKDLSKHVDMYGQEESYKADENIRDVVKLGLPIPFLKVWCILKYDFPSYLCIN